MGLLILTVPTNIVLPLLVVGLIWFVRAHFRATLALFTSMLSVRSFPWTMRNYVVFRFLRIRFIQLWSEFVLGNSEQTSPNSGVNVDVSQYEVIAKHMNEIDQDAFYRNAALDFIRGHKVRTVTLYLQKFVNYFNFHNDLRTTSEASRFNDLVVLITYGPLRGGYHCRVTLAKSVSP